MKLALSLLCLVIILSAAQAAWAQSLSFIPLDHWSYQAFDRLASLGLLPLTALASKPITRREARRLLEGASARVRDADPTISRLAREDLRRLIEEFSIDSPVVITASGLADNRQAGSFAPVRSMSGASVSLRLAPTDASALFLRVGGNGEMPASSWNEFYASFQSGSVFGQVGRTTLWWSPSPRSSLLLSDNAGAVPLLRIVADLPRVRLTKAIISLERAGGSPSGDVVLFATRLDWLATPRFRLGLNEAVVTTWGAPLTLYHLLQPLPVFSAIVASYDLHDALGQARNTSVAIDFDWLLRPGIRLYGSALIDDAPEHIGTRAKVGVLMGLHLVDPFRTGNTSLRLEYSAVSDGTYSYAGGLEYAYRGRSLGHWLGPDGDDFYAELTSQLSSASSLQLSYAYTRHGQGRIGQAPPPPEAWFLSGVVERRHTLGIQLQTSQSRSLEMRYRAQIASVTNRGNVAGANGWEGMLGVELTYRWPSPAQAPVTAAASAAQPAPLEQPTPVAASAVGVVLPGRLALRTWTTAIASRGPLSGPTTSTAFWGVTYRTNLGTPLLSLALDVAGQGEQMFWSADLLYPLVQFEHGTISVLGGAGGLTYRGELGGTTRFFSLWGPRLGGAFNYRLTLNNVATPLYFTGEISSPLLRAILSPQEGDGRFSLWTYNLGVGWRGQSGISLQAGYRGAAAIWRDETPDKTFLRWDGFYAVFSLSR